MRSLFQRLITSPKRFFFVFAFVLVVFPVQAQVNEVILEQMVEAQQGEDEALKKLNAEIEEKSEKVEQLTKQLYVYDQNIKEKQQEQASLENQISVLDDSLQETETEIERSNIEIEVLQLEVEALQKQIEQSEADIADNKASLESLIRELYAQDQRTPLEITFNSQNFSDFFSSIEYTQKLQGSVNTTLSKIEKIHTQLTERRTQVKEKKADVSLKVIALESEQEELEGVQKTKEQLLADTEQSEEAFQGLLEKARKEQAAIESEVSALERKAREKINLIREEALKKLQDADQSNDVLTPEEQDAISGKTDFVWPVDSRRVTCSFHCVGPYYNIFGAHSGMDIGTPMGSPVYATASGYVTRAVFNPNSTSFAFIMINHLNGGFSSLYGHLSCVNVVYDQYVVQGQQIGCSGGMPGTAGAGYSSGPHLHFEIRVNGIVTDPAQYLP